ncbi:LysR family transcriptional regulator [Bradyrhizobium sp. CSA207]|uniref:LysR family transcriptional regulator n=1 Tax=Bradyrhizobium sp. CSA207 TaxID=2698826 RepID=UPI0023B11BBC|nr:LysR family transcriptional regulator [Bradyrhizobium sp. CSA207]MDE5443873.1 LysR family transcriptional regulator [Bradyrhizobium sp. CSA207]
MDRLEAMSAIIAVAETGSISAASRRLKLPVATISRKVSELEARLKAQLFQRTSRRMTLTDAGRSYIEACKRIVEQVEDAERELSGEYRLPKGEMAVTAPWGLGHTHLLPHTIEFLDAHPDISLRLKLTDAVVNITDENIDVAIRIGPLPESSMIATRIGSIRIVVCASPSYLKTHGRPKTLGDLAKHQCITIDDHAAATAWRFVSGNRTRAAPIRSQLCVNTSEAAVLAAIDGAGLARVMSYKMDGAMRERKLDIVLDEFEPTPLPVHILYPPRKPMPIKLRTFLNWMTPRLKEQFTL